MDVRLLSTDPDIAAFIRCCGDTLVESDGDWLVSFGHRKIISAMDLMPYGAQAINLHISALPWNRGASPNYWAWRNGTPHGVTLHRLTEGLDSGPIIAQRRLVFGPGFTLNTSWLRLMAEARALFMEFWPELRTGQGSFHRAADLPGDVDWGESCG